MEVAFQEIIADLFSGRPGKGLDKLQACRLQPPTPQLLAALRLAAQRPGQNLLYYTRLFNLWQGWGRPELKPNVARRKITLLTDFTADGLGPLLSLFAAAWGVELEVGIPGFDSVEQVVLSGTPENLGVDQETLVVLLLSEQWFTRYFGNSVLVREADLERTQQTYQSLVDGLRRWGANRILLANLAGRAYPAPAGIATHGDWIGWNLAMWRFNAWLTTLTSSSVHVVDVAQAIASAGGESALGHANFFRARMAFEAPGAVAVARELAAAIASICGKSHRAVVTDWDNTLWGGEVAEVGSFGVVCGVDSPEALGYWRVQDYLRCLRQLGVVLSGVSRNDPKVQAVFDENRDLPLRLDDFASLQVRFGPKSQSIAQVSKELGFGTEFMLFLDDSLFELAEAVAAHPYLDVLRAGPDGESTLAALAHARPGNTVALSDEDMQRATAAQSLRQQREMLVQFDNLDQFLQSINIQLQVSGVDERNMARVVQMFQKSNQFNLTTRRHGEQSLGELIARGATVGVFSYTDNFGPQGIISVVVLLPEEGQVRIESWLMSCRVLNRTVEDAVFDWILAQAGTRNIIGDYLPTQKNELVRELLPRFGFRVENEESSTGARRYGFQPATIPFRPTHFANLQRAA